MNVAIVDQAAELWGQGVDAKVIGAALGLSQRQVYSISEYYRDKFPRRQVLEVSEAQIARASEMWLGGLTIPQMRAALNFSEHQIDRMRRLNPQLFPRRIRLAEGYLFPKENPPAPPTIHHDRVRWITESGAAITLPRVSFISCPRSA